MFQQSLLTEAPGRNGWTLAASFSGQVLLLGLLAAIPLIFTDSLSPSRFIASISLPVPPGGPPSVSKAAPVKQRATPSLLHEFTAPSRIRPLVETRDVPSLPDAPEIGVTGGVGTLPALAGVIGSVMHSIAPPPPPPPAQPAAKPDPVVPSKPISVSSGVQSAKLLKQVIPAYPALAKSARISGTVRLIGVIGKDGTIQKLQVVSGHPLLTAAALDAVRQWIYRPTLLNGNPVEVVSPIDVNFTLNP